MKLFKMPLLSLMIILNFSLLGCGQKEEFVKNIAVKKSSPLTTTLAWDPVTTRENGEKILASEVGYKLFYGKVSKTYTDRIDVGSVSVTEYTLQNVNFPKGKYYFAVAAYDKKTGVEGLKSDEISVDFP